MVKYVVLGLMGATAGYLLLKGKLGAPGSATAGAVLAIGPVLLFQPGGYLRS